MHFYHSIQKNLDKIYPARLRYFFTKIGKDSISAYSAQAAFFIMLSFFPFIIIVISLTQYMPFNANDVTQLILSLVPQELQTYINTILDDIYGRSSGAVLSLSIITVIWSASRGFLSLTNCFNKVYEIKESRNYFIIRGISAIYTLAMALLLIITLTLFVFGNKIFYLIIKYFPVLGNTVHTVKSLKNFVGVIIFFMFFVLIYIILPNRKIRIIDVMPGAVFSTVGWLALSFAFSIYIDYFTSFSYMYGSLASIVVSLLWLYFSMYIVFLGCEINYYWWENLTIKIIKKKSGRYKIKEAKKKDKKEKK